MKISNILSLALVLFMTSACDTQKEKDIKTADLEKENKVNQIKLVLNKSDDPQVYYELGICFESINVLIRRSDEYRLSSKELESVSDFYNKIGPFDVAVKQIINNYCPSGVNEACASEFPQNTKAFLEGASKVIQSFNSSQDTNLISFGGAGNNPMVQRFVMEAYCSRYGYHEPKM